jgi:hypothetical protein
VFETRLTMSRAPCATGEDAARIFCRARGLIFAALALRQHGWPPFQPAASS